MSEHEGFRWTDGEVRTAADIRREFGSLWGEHEAPPGTHAYDAARSHRELIVQRLIARQPRVYRDGTDYTAPYSLGLHLAAFREAADRGLLKRLERQPDMEL